MEIRGLEGKGHKGGNEDKGGRGNGWGKETLANGDVFEGEWKDGKLHGKCIRTHANGNIIDEEWEDGELVKNIPRSTFAELDLEVEIDEKQPLEEQPLPETPLQKQPPRGSLNLPETGHPCFDLPAQQAGKDIGCELLQGAAREKTSRANIGNCEKEGEVGGRQIAKPQSMKGTVSNRKIQLLVKAEQKEMKRKVVY